MHDTMA